MSYQRRPEVIALAKMRVDRSHAPGAWDECVKSIFEGDSEALKHTLDKLLIDELNKAEQDIADVRAVLGLN